MRAHFWQILSPLEDPEKAHTPYVGVRLFNRKQILRRMKGREQKAMERNREEERIYDEGLKVKYMKI